MKHNIFCENAIEDNGIIYFVAFHGRLLYAYDKNSKTTKSLGAIPNQSVNGMRLFESIIKIGSKIIIAPSGADSVMVVYDLNNEEFTCVNLGIDSKGFFKFNSIIPFENNVYLIGQSLHIILKVNLDDYKIEKIYENNNSGSWMCINGFVLDEYAYIPFVELSSFIKLNLKTSEIEIINYDSSIKSCCGILKGTKDDLWIIGLNEPYLINTDYKGNVIKEVLIEELNGLHTPYGLFENPVIEENKIYLFPLGARNIYCYNTETDTVEKCKEFASITNSAFSNPNNSRLFSFQAREQYIYLVEANNKVWHEVSLLDRTYNSFEVFQDPEVITRRWKYGITESNNERLTDLFDVLR